MDNTQAHAIAQAILQPDLQAQQQLRRKQALAAARLARQRRVAAFTLAGAAVGAAVAVFSGVRFTDGVLWGGLPAALVGWLVAGWSARRSTA